MSTAIAALSLAVWIYLIGGRGAFWRGWREPEAPRLADAPAVAVIIPARNEAECVGGTLQALFAQDYPGPLHVVLVDDHSSDGTAERAGEAARRAGAGGRLTIIAAPDLPAGWAGKVWAMNAGVEHLRSIAPEARYVLFTDADITHAPDSICRLVARAEADALDLTSLMVRLRCNSWAERALVPAFVYFFRMLYPFAWVNDPGRSLAGAAGGCMLVRRTALEQIGGMAAIRDRIIDDCALAAAIKPGGAIRLDVADRTESTRDYPEFGDVWRLIARTAFTELRYSPTRLLVAVVGLTLVFLVPPAFAICGNRTAQWLGLTSWLIMAASFVPCLHYHRRLLLWAPALPLIAMFYLGATLDSARRHWLGRGGGWKGRAQSASIRTG